MASSIQEVEVNKGLYFKKIRELSSSHSYINIPVPVLTALESLDGASYKLWTVLYQLGYFSDGATTITLDALAVRLKISRSSLETKIGTLIENGFLIRKHNFDQERHQYLASTFYVRLPDQTIETISQQPTRKEILNDAGIYITKDFQKDAPILAPIDAIQEKVIQDELEEIKAAKADAINKLDKLEKTTHSGLALKVQIMEQKAKLKALSEKEEKNLAAELSTSSPNKKGRSPNGCESNINNSRKIGIINNNNHVLSNAAQRQTDIQHLSTDNYSFASQDARGNKAKKGYRNTPVALPEKIKAKIQKAVYDTPTVSNPEEIIAEGEFAVSRCFTGITLDHAANTFCKLLRQEKWRTPIPLQMAKQTSEALSLDINHTHEGKK